MNYHCSLVLLTLHESPPLAVSCSLLHMKSVVFWELAFVSCVGFYGMEIWQNWQQIWPQYSCFALFGLSWSCSWSIGKRSFLFYVEATSALISFVGLELCRNIALALLTKDEM